MSEELYTIDDLEPDALASVSELAAGLIAAQAEYARIEAQLEMAKAVVTRIETVDLPDAMKALGLSSMTLTSGASLSIREEVSVGISEKNEATAFEWLRTSGNDSIIKRLVALTFGKGEDAKAAAVAEKLARLAPGVPLINKSSVHHSTLKAFVKERLKIEEHFPEMDEKLPREAFGVFIINRAIVKPPKGD